MINKKGIDIILTIAYPVVMPKYIVSVDASRILSSLG